MCHHNSKQMRDTGTILALSRPLALSLSLFSRTFGSFDLGPQNIAGGAPYHSACVCARISIVGS